MTTLRNKGKVWLERVQDPVHPLVFSLVRFEHLAEDGRGTAGQGTAGSATNREKDPWEVSAELWQLPRIALVHG